MNNPYAQYRQTSIETASPEKLIIMLYDGAIKFLNIAIEAMESNDFGKSNLFLQKTQDIIQELRFSLDMNVEIAQNLNALYDYFSRQIVEANIKKEPIIAKQVLGFLQELRETWAQASLNLKNSGGSVQAGLNIQG